MSMLAFWVVTPCGLVGRYQRLGGIWRYNPEDQHRYLHRRENLRSQNLEVMSISGRTILKPIVEI
jgi:hypothetical protein